MTYRKVLLALLGALLGFGALLPGPAQAAPGTTGQQWSMVFETSTMHTAYYSRELSTRATYFDRNGVVLTSSTGASSKFVITMMGGYPAPGYPDTEVWANARGYILQGGYVQNVQMEGLTVWANDNTCRAYNGAPVNTGNTGAPPTVLFTPLRSTPTIGVGFGNGSYYGGAVASQRNYGGALYVHSVYSPPTARAYSTTRPANC